MKDIGAAGPGDLAKLKPNYDKAFILQKVDTTRLEGAQALSDAVTSTGIYYVPLCDGSRCPMMAAFSRDASGAPIFESIGQPNLTRQIKESSARAAGDSSLTGDTKVVQFNEGHAGFLLATKANGEEVLIPHSDEEGKMLQAILNRPVADTDSAGRARFSLAEMRIIARNVREHAETHDTAPTSGLSDPSDINNDKPVNRAGTSSEKADAESRSSSFDIGERAILTLALVHLTFTFLIHT
jgi:hypothetical protein